MVKRSEFGSIENFRIEFNKAVRVFKDLEPSSGIQKRAYEELEKFSGLITLTSEDSTTGVRDAAAELIVFCRRRLPNVYATQ